MRPSTVQNPSSIHVGEIKNKVYDDLPTMKQLCSIQDSATVNRIKSHIAIRQIDEKNQQQLESLQPRQFRLIPTNNQMLVQRQIKLFKQRVANIQQSDFAYLCMYQAILEKQVNMILQLNTITPENRITQTLEYLLTVLDLKIESMQKDIRRKSEDKELPIRQLYPKISRIQYKLKARISSNKFKSSIKENMKRHVSDILFNYYIRQLEDRQHHANFELSFVFPYSRQIVMVQSAIPYCSWMFEPQRGWRTLFQQMKSYYKPRIQNTIMLRLEQHFINNIEGVIFPNIQCIGCSQFFYAAQNIYNPSICKHKLALMGSTDRLVSKQDDIIQQICGLLNNNGGVILFDCVLSYLNTYARGNFFDQKKMKDIEGKIALYLENIRPSPCIGTHIFISWVPLAENPIRRQSLRRKYNPSIKWIDNNYVLRITVKPENCHKTYHCQTTVGELYVIRTKSIFLQHLRKIAGTDNINEIRSHKANLVNKLLAFQRHSLNHFKDQGSFLINHKCLSTKINIKTYSTQYSQEIQSALNAQTRQSGQNTQKTCALNRQIGGRQQYIHMSVMLYFIIQPEMLHYHLKQYGIYGKIVHLQNTTIFYRKVAILYHNCRFEQLAIMQRQKNISFRFFYVTDYLRVANTIIHSASQIHKIRNKILTKYPTAALKLWRLKRDSNSNQEFYFETGTREVSAQLFAIIHENQTSCVAFFKDPQNIQYIRSIEDNPIFRPYYLPVS